MSVSGLVVFLVTLFCPSIYNDGEDAEGCHLMSNTMEVASSHENGADGIDEIVHWVHIR